jgi:hypothetical protein
MVALRYYKASINNSTHSSRGLTCSRKSRFILIAFQLITSSSVAPAPPLPSESLSPPPAGCPPAAASKSLPTSGLRLKAVSALILLARLVPLPPPPHPPPPPPAEAFVSSLPRLGPPLARACMAAGRALAARTRRTARRRSWATARRSRGGPRKPARPSAAITCGNTRRSCGYIHLRIYSALSCSKQRSPSTPSKQASPPVLQLADKLAHPVTNTSRPIPMAGPTHLDSHQHPQRCEPKHHCRRPGPARPGRGAERGLPQHAESVLAGVEGAAPLRRHHLVCRLDIIRQQSETRELGRKKDIIYFWGFPSQFVNQPRGNGHTTRTPPGVSLPSRSRARYLQVLNHACKPLRYSEDVHRQTDRQTGRQADRQTDRKRLADG